MTDIAGDVDIRKEVHLDLDVAVSVAVLAASARNIEAESSAPVATGLALGKACIEVPDVAPDLDICSRIRTWGLSYRTLVNLNQLIEILGTFNGFVSIEFLGFPVESVSECRSQDLVEQSALSAS